MGDVGEREGVFVEFDLGGFLLFLLLLGFEFPLDGLLEDGAIASGEGIGGDLFVGKWA